MTKHTVESWKQTTVSTQDSPPTSAKVRRREPFWVLNPEAANKWIQETPTTETMMKKRGLSGESTTSAPQTRVLNVEWETGNVDCLQERMFCFPEGVCSSEQIHLFGLPPVRSASSGEIRNKK